MKKLLDRISRRKRTGVQMGDNFICWYEEIGQLPKRAK